MTAAASARPDPARSVGGAGEGAPEPSLLSIGEVLVRLRTDFPDTTISKLRFLEAEGLVQPHRAPSGYRKYSAADLARLRFILAAQRDHYLPLRVIREQLAALDRGEPGAVAVRAGLRATGAGHPDRLDRLDRLSRSELLERSGLAEQTLQSLEEYGLIRPRGGGYDADTLAVADAVAGLCGYGLAPRHLRAYRAAADRDVGLFTQLAAPLLRQSAPGAQARAEQTLQELAALSQQLHAALVRIGLRDQLRG